MDDLKKNKPKWSLYIYTRSLKIRFTICLIKMDYVILFYVYTNKYEYVYLHSAVGRLLVASDDFV